MARDIGKTDAYVVSRRRQKTVEMLFARPTSDLERLVCFREVRQASGMTTMGALQSAPQLRERLLLYRGPCQAPRLHRVILQRS